MHVETGIETENAFVFCFCFVFNTFVHFLFKIAT